MAGRSKRWSRVLKPPGLAFLFGIALGVLLVCAKPDLVNPSMQATGPSPLAFGAVLILIFAAALALVTWVATLLLSAKRK